MTGDVRHLTAFCLLLVVVHVESSHGRNRILLYPADHPGHVKYHLVLGQALLKNGYDVYMLSMEKHRSRIESAEIKPLLHKPIKAISVHDDPAIQGKIQELILMGEKAGLRPTLALAAMVLARFNGQVEEVLQNEELQTKIKGLDFDLAVIDGASVLHAPLVVAYKHGIKYATVTPLSDPWSAGLPGMPSVEPMPTGPTSDQMSFLERTQNLFFYIMTAVMPVLTSPDHLVKKYAPDRPYRTLAELHNQAEMYFTNTDPYLLDYSRVSGTNFVFLGAIGGEPAKPLKPELEQFVSSAQDGAVVVSFGSVAKELPASVLNKLLGAFTLFPTFHFVMRHDGKVKDLPENVRLLKWLPQNDLLGHKNTRLFITHGGNNGQIEALYHGVPTVVAPLFGDQAYNAHRFAVKGYGVKVNLLDSTEGEVVVAMREVLENPKYTKAIKKAQAIHHALPKGNETLAFWVDHVIKHGSKHLRPVSMGFPLYRLFMLDVLLAVFLVFVAIICSNYKCARWCCRKCHKEKNKSKKD